jgi:hypothetical protein
LNTIDKLRDFRSKSKFADSAWEQRGLNPSDPDLCNKMERLLNNCIDSLLLDVENNSSIKVLKNTLVTGLKSFKSVEYDIEEREFICDYFDTLSHIVDINISDNLNDWLYGKGLSSIMKISALLKKPDKIIETLSQDCTNCQAKLETFIHERQPDIPETDYMIVRCTNCGEYNLIDNGSGIKRSSFGNYEWVEFLRKTDYDEEKAKIRLEQIKYYRK